MPSHTVSERAKKGSDHNTGHNTGHNTHEPKKALKFNRSLKAVSRDAVRPGSRTAGLPTMA